MSIPSARWLSLLVLPFSSCILVVGDDDWDGYHSSWGHSVRGSGVRTEEERQVGRFRAIDLETCATVRVEVGGEPSLRIAGDDNIVPEVQTRVENGVLSIDLPGSYSFQRRLELTIHTPELERFTIEGSGDVEIRGLAAEDVELAIEGSGTIRAQGTARSLTGSIEGSGELELAELAAESADLSIEGSGSMEVQVARELHYSIEGSGDICYAGEPALGGEIDGSGDIHKNR